MPGHHSRITKAVKFDHDLISIREPNYSWGVEYTKLKFYSTLNGADKLGKNER